MKIISLLPSATEILCALGLADTLVGISHECDYPPSILSLPRVTHSYIPEGKSLQEIDQSVTKRKQAGVSLYGIHQKWMEILAPDIILTQGLCDVCALTPADLEQELGKLPASTQIISMSGMTLEGIFADILQVAQACHVLDQAHHLIETLRQRWSQIVPVNPSPRVVFLEWVDPFFSSGHWVPEQITVAGGKDVLSQAGSQSRRVSPEEIAFQRPDLVLVGACGYGLEANVEQAQFLKSHPILRDLPAIQQHLWALDANAAFSRPAPRVIDGAETLALIFQKWKSGSSEKETIPRAKPV
jgi:iron complex transport system substrate-binding protein